MGATCSADLHSVRDVCMPKETSLDTCNFGKNSDLKVKVQEYAVPKLARYCVSVSWHQPLFSDIRKQGIIGIRVSGSKLGIATFVSQLFPWGGAALYKQVVIASFRVSFAFLQAVGKFNIHHTACSELVRYYWFLAD